jgi:hypothetical protein
MEFDIVRDHEKSAVFGEAVEVTHLTSHEIRGADVVLELALDRLRMGGATSLPKAGDLLEALELKYGVSQH